MRSSPAANSSSITSLAGRRLPSRASTSWMVRMAAAKAMAARLNMRSASMTWLSSSGEAIGLERTEGLLDPPAQTIELHDFLGLDGVADRERGQEAPQQRSGARWCLDFSCLHQSELDGFGHAGYTAVLRAGNAYGSGAQFHLGDSSLVARPARRHAYLTGYQSSGSAQGLEQPPACGQPAILPGADDQIEPFRLGAEERIDIAFAVGDHRHRGGFEQTFGRSH